MNSFDKFVSLGGQFEADTYCTYLIYGGRSMRIPNHYFTSEDDVEKNILNYYLDMMPKIMDSKYQSTLNNWGELIND
jgi:hypothetical protein